MVCSDKAASKLHHTEQFAAHWLPPSERAKLEKHEDQEPKENKEANRSMESAGNNSTEP